MHLKQTAALVVTSIFAAPMYGVVYVALLYNSGLAAFGAADDLCPGGPLADPALRQHLFPLINQCFFTNGDVRNKVPNYANPVLFAASIVLGILFLWTSLAIIHTAVVAMKAIIYKSKGGYEGS